MHYDTIFNLSIIYKSHNWLWSLTLNREPTSGIFFKTFSPSWNVTKRGNSRLKGRQQLMLKSNYLHGSICYVILTDNANDRFVLYNVVLARSKRCCILSPRHLTWEMQIKALVLDKWMIAGLDTIMKQLRNTNDLDCSARLAFIHAGNRSTQRIFINVRHKYFLCHDAHEHDCHTFSLVTNTKHDKRKMTREPTRSSTAIIARSMY